jgi:NADH-quinone oxidoreductase subunit C
MHNEIVSFLNSAVAGSEAVATEPTVGDKAIFVNPKHILKICEQLKASDKFQMNVLQVITGCDYPDRIEVSYILASFILNTEVILKVKLPKVSKDAVPEIDSVCSVWKAANFQERECFDMLGVKFNGHPDHRRILCPDDWEGFPLRKDYVVQEKWDGLVVNPAHKVNSDDHSYYKRITEMVGDPKKVVFSWKGDGDADEVQAE